MQTRNFGLRGITLALAGVLTLGLAACDDTDVVPAPLPATLEVTPAGPLDLAVGDQVTLVASFDNAPAGSTVSWSSSGAAVTVSGNGNQATVTGASEGTATVIAALSNTTLTKAVQVRVTAGSVPPPPDSAFVSIVEVVDTNGNSVEADNVAGPIAVRVDYERGDAARLQVLVNNTVACDQTFGSSNIAADVDAALASAQFVCPINTVRTDSTGAPTFPNGPVNLTARLLNAQNETLATANFDQQLTFNNANTITLEVVAERTGLDAGDLEWNGGDVTVTAFPAIFTGGTASRVTIIAFDDANGNGIQDAGEATISSQTVTGAPFTVTFAADNAPGAPDQGLEGLALDSLAFRATSVAGGAAGPSTIAASSISYDNVAPGILAATALPAWTGANFALRATGADSLVTATDANSGVGTVTFHAAPVASVTGMTDEEIAENNPAITSAGQLAQTTTTNGYVVVARATDAVGNSNYLRLGTIGVDLEVPTFTFANTTVADSINPVGNFDLSFTDQISGPAGQPFEVQGTFVNARGTYCVNLVTGAIAATTATNAAECGFKATASSSIAVPPLARDGYVTATFRVVDQAGNVSTTASRVILVDNGLPTVTISSTTIAGSDITVSGTIADSVDLRSYDLRQDFGGVRLPVGPVTTVGSFGQPLTTSQAVTGSTTVYRGLQQAGAGGAITAGVGITDVSGAGFGATDVAGNFAFAGSTVSGITSDGVADTGVETWAITNTDLTICGTGSTAAAACGSGSSAVPATRTLTAVASNTSDPGAFAQPFGTVWFFRQDAAGAWHLIGSTNSATLQTTATERTWTYSLQWNAAGLPADATVDVIAVGVDSERDLGATQPVVFDVR